MGAERIPLARKAALLAESPDGILAVYKPPGMKSHPNRKGEIAVLTAPYDPKEECFKSEEGRIYFLCNRLDAPTSGILILAKNETLAQAIKSAFREKQVEKTYLAAVLGEPPEPSGIWKDTLQVEKGRGVVRARRGPTNKGKGKTAVTEFQFLEKHEKFGKSVSLLMLHPQTGRTHQLRVQTSRRGIPILGDKTYGNFSFNKQIRKVADIRRLLLHAHAIRIQFPESNHSPFAARTELPEWVIQYFKFRGQGY